MILRREVTTRYGAPTAVDPVPSAVEPGTVTGFLALNSADTVPAREEIGIRADGPPVRPLLAALRGHEVSTDQPPPAVGPMSFPRVEGELS